MKLSRGACLLLLLQLACGFLVAQDLTPPQKMHVCAENGICQDLKWAGDHYDAFLVGKTQLDARYWVQRWSAQGIELNGKWTHGDGGIFPIEGTVTGTIGPSGNRIDKALFDWRIGYNQAGKMAFTLTWDKAAGGIALADVNSAQPGHRSRTHPNILLPLGASEKYAAYPADVRAILMATHPLSSQDAARPCAQMGRVPDPDIMLEIAKYAYRADDIARGNCWATAAAVAGNIHAKTIIALGWVTGWQGEPDGVKSCQEFTPIGEQDPWAVYFIMTCTREGVGTPKDEAKADWMANWFRMASGRNALFGLINSDDLEVQRQNERQAVLDHPPMMRDRFCHPTYVRGTPLAGSCKEVPDEALMQRYLDGIDAKYADIK